MVEFLGCSLNGVIPPDDPDVEVIRRYRCVIEHGLELLASTDKQAARMLRADFQNRLKMMRRTEEDNMFNLRDYRDGGEELAPLAQRVFAEAQRGCA